MTNEQSLIKTDLCEYVCIHRWIRYHHGKAKYCSFDKNHKAKRYDWALKKGYAYARKIENFIQLCPSCHGKMDFTEKRREWLRKANLKNKNAGKSINQYSLLGEFIKSWNSSYEAARGIGISRTGITNNLTGRSKTCGGFIWKRA